MLAVDVGATRVRFGSAGNHPDGVLPTWHDADSLLAGMSELITASPETTVGVCCPGLVDGNGFVGVSFLRALRKLPLAVILGRRTKKRVFVLNDVEAQALGTEPTPCLAYFGFGTRVGGAVAEYGNVGTRRALFRGEFGHLAAGGASDERCECGAIDCLDLFAAGMRLQERFGDWWAHPAKVDEVAEHVAPRIAAAVRSALVTLGPTRIALAGNLVGHQSIRELVVRELSTTIWEPPRVDFHPDTWPLVYLGLQRYLDVSFEGERE